MGDFRDECLRSRRGAAWHGVKRGSEWLSQTAKSVSQESSEVEKDDSLQIFDTTIVHIVVRVHTVRKQKREKEENDVMFVSLEIDIDLSGVFLYFSLL